ncbi:hypothetical protein F5Y18DRAFT_379145 [Xylariaceae sp. FL1019]|nr:hypothetical protein F5Y18DRAFT_379145 [Xylariaceae sp. FL1019]
MSQAPTIKELTKSIASFAQAPVLPLPDDLIQLIEDVTNRYADKSNENISEKLNDELLSIFNRDIVSEPSRHAAFLAILRRLRPLIGLSTKMLQWYELFLPSMNRMHQVKDLAAEGRAFVLDIMAAENASDTSGSFTGGAAVPLAERLMLLWLQDCELFQKHLEPRRTFQEKEIRETMLLYGKKRPKDFMMLVDRFVCKRQHRGSALLLLSAFIQSQPPHLYLILQTPLFGNLLNCLQRDTSTTIISLALTALTMVLPHVPSSLLPYLPLLFNIYARLLFWERELSSITAEADKERRLSPNALAWEKCPFSPETDTTAIPQLFNYFTILYGLYPINLMDYIRKPQRYLRHADVADAEEVEVQPTEIRHASERLRQCHVLHENFYTLTLESEKTDFGRWIKSEPSEVVADCMALRQQSDEASDPGFLDLANMVIPEKDGGVSDETITAFLINSIIPRTSSFSLLQEEIHRSSGSALSELVSGGQSQPTVARYPSPGSARSSSTRRSVHESDSPSLLRPVHTSGSQTQLQDLINSNKAVKSSLHQTLTNDSVPSLSLSHHDPNPEKAFSSSHLSLPAGSSKQELQSSESSDYQHLQLLRYVFLLHNDLLFERFMKQQHLTHIGELRRRYVREAASEAETQNLIIANRHLKQRLEEAKKAELQAKTEAEKSRTLSKKWEADIFNKLKLLREEQKKWNVEGSTLRADLQSAREEAEKLRTLVCDVEVRELKLKQTMQSADINCSELERLRNEVERLVQSERDYQSADVKRQAADSQASEADSRAKEMDMKLIAQESDFKQTSTSYRAQIALLESKLQEALKSKGDRGADGLQKQLVNALEANRTSQDEMNRRLSMLVARNSALQAKIFEMESEIPVRSKAMPYPPAEIDEDVSSESDSLVRNRRRRGFSDPEIFEPLSYNATPPLDLVEKNRPTGSQGRPATPPQGGEDTARSRESPTTERYFGRGGLQNTRTGKKEKKEDKEKKKSTGLRGIRGFV